MWKYFKYVVSSYIGNIVLYIIYNMLCIKSIFNNMNSIIPGGSFIDPIVYMHIYALIYIYIYIYIYTYMYYKPYIVDALFGARAQDDWEPNKLIL